MTRFEQLLVVALLSVTLAGLGLHWLWRQRGLRPLTRFRKGMVVMPPTTMDVTQHLLPRRAVQAVLLAVGEAELDRS